MVGSKSARNAILGISKQFDVILHNGRKDFKHDRGEVIGPLIREYAVIKYCTAGSGEISCDYGTFHVRAGQCFVVLPGQVMTEIADANDPWVHTWVTIGGIRTGMMFQSVGISPKSPLLPWESNPEFLKALQSAIDVYDYGSDESEFRRIGHAFLIFDQLAQYMRSINPAVSEESRTDIYVKKAVYFMETHCSEPINVTDVAEYLGITRCYLFSLFKAKMHMPPQEYLTKLRMQKACELFSYPNSTVSSVCNALNYEPSVFYRNFKRIVGKSPSEYRNQAVKNALLFEE